MSNQQRPSSLYSNVAVLVVFALIGGACASGDVQAADSLLEEATESRDAGDLEAAVVALDEVITRYEDTSDPDLQERVADALGLKGVELGKAGRLDEALAAFEEVIAR